MIKNYIKIALRNLKRQKFYSLVTIFGLSAGFTCFLLILIYVQGEFSYDKFHEDSDRIYRIVQTITEDDGERQTALIAPRVGDWAKSNLPEVEDMTRFFVAGRMTVGNEVEKRDYEHMFIADSNFFEFFTFPLIKGDPLEAMSDPSGLMLTQETAEKYFQGEIPGIGEEIYNNVYDSRVSGVVENLPTNSHLDFDIILTEPAAASLFESWWENYINTNWTSNGLTTYLKLRKGANPANVEMLLQEEARKHYEAEDNAQFSFYLQPLEDIHFYSEGIEGGVNVGSSKVYYSYLFISIGLLIVLVACFNYMNLSTTAAVRRTKEVGLRKTVGAQKSQLISQFLLEALLLSFLALGIAILLVDLLLPALNEFMNKTLVFQLQDWRIILGLIGLALFTGILSGLYPALVTANVSPAKALKSNTSGKQKFTIRKLLVIAQFTVAITMITSTVIIYNQLNFIRSRDLGFQVNDLMVIDINSGNLRSNFAAIKNDLNEIPGLESVSVSSRVPGEWKVTPIINAHALGSDEKFENIFIGADHDFLKTFDVDLLEGRNFQDKESDSTSVILNKAAADRLGTKDVIGTRIIVDEVNWNGSLQELEEPYEATVVGIVENFSFESVRDELKPMMIGYRINPLHSIDYFTVRYNTAEIDNLLAEVKRVNNLYDAENPVEYHFLDEQFQRFYEEDQQRGKLFLIFSSVVVILSCMGLFALASYMTRLRLKEVGIRKVLGARSTEIVYLLIKDFTLLVAIAFVIAVPIGYFTMDSWLDDFVYKVGIPWWTFFIAGFGVLIISMLTISSITFRAASVNPVKTLKNE